LLVTGLLRGVKFSSHHIVREEVKNKLFSFAIQICKKTTQQDCISITIKVIQGIGKGLEVVRLWGGLNRSREWLLLFRSLVQNINNSAFLRCNLFLRFLVKQSWKFITMLPFSLC